MTRYTDQPVEFLNLVTAELHAGGKRPPALFVGDSRVTYEDLAVKHVLAGYVLVDALLHVRYTSFARTPWCLIVPLQDGASRYYISVSEIARFAHQRGSYLYAEIQQLYSGSSSFFVCGYPAGSIMFGAPRFCADLQADDGRLGAILMEKMNGLLSRRPDAPLALVYY